MKTLLLILSVFALSACKGTSNKTSASQNVSAYVQKAYMTIPHNDDSSLLREKLLHLKLSSLLKQTTALKIEKLDQFKFARETFQTNTSEQFDYEKQKESSAEIVVSYDDHLEIYFVPTGILRDQVSADLNLKAEEGRILGWMPGTPTTLLKGQTYFVLSASKADLLLNDQKYSVVKIPASSDTKTIHKFSPYQKVLLSFSLESFSPEITIASVSGGAQAVCKSDMREAGLCEPCMAKIEKTSGKFVKQPWSLQQFGLVLLINGKETQVQALAPKLDEKTGMMTVVLDLHSLAAEEREVTLQLVKPAAHQQSKSVSPFSYSGNCRSHSGASSVLDLTPQVEMTYLMDIQGRNIQL